VLSANIYDFGRKILIGSDDYFAKFTEKPVVEVWMPLLQAYRAFYVISRVNHEYEIEAVDPGI